MPTKIDPTLLTLFRISLGFFVKISKCSGAIKLIVSINIFLFFTNIDKPKFFKLLDAIFFFGKDFNCSSRK